MKILAAVTSICVLILMVGIAIWFWWPQVQNAVAYWGWPVW